jgi:hypothetical protein
MIDQPPLFDPPEGAFTPRPKRGGKSAAVRYAQYKPKTRQLCDDCIALIHALGQGIAPFPRPVRWRRSSPDGVLHLCEAHRSERQECEQ